MKQATKRLVSLAMGVVFIIAALFIFFELVQPAYEADQALKAEKISQENFFENQKSTQKQVDEIIKAYKGSGNPQALANLAIPPEKDEANLINQLSVLAGKNQLAIQNITVSIPGPKAISAKAKAASSTLVRPVGVLNAQIRVAGTYQGLKMFLSGLESNLRIMDINGLAVSPVGKANQDYYTFDIAVVAYYQNP